MEALPKEGPRQGVFVKKGSFQGEKAGIWGSERGHFLEKTGSTVYR